MRDLSILNHKKLRQKRPYFYRGIYSELSCSSRSLHHLRYTMRELSKLSPKHMHWFSHHDADHLDILALGEAHSRYSQ